MTTQIALLFAATDALVSDLDLPGIGSLSIATAVLVLVFRTLWRQEATWKSLIEQERLAGAVSREDASAARADAEVARHEAAEAREAAAQFRRELSDTRDELERSRLETQRAWAAHANEIKRVDRLVEALRQAGVPLPADLN